MRLGLILTNDWEVFGDGSGDFFELQERPLSQLREVCESAGAKLTIFAEVGQQLWGYRAQAQDPACAKVAAAWEECLRQAVRAGHDVQCHLHPQWLNAGREGGRWQLDFAMQGTATVPAERLPAVLAQAKSYLESVLQPVQPAYRCRCYRAGGYALQPSAGPLRALQSTGFDADTSVMPGLHGDDSTDYRRAPHPFLPWRMEAEATRPARDGPLWELPIYAQPVGDSALLRKLIAPGWMLRRLAGQPVPAEDITWQKARNANLLHLYPLSERAAVRAHGRWRLILSRLWQRTVLSLDYDQMPPVLFARFLRQALTEAPRLAWPGETIPIVAIGHTKGIPDGRNLGRILQLIKRELGEQLEFWTINEALNNLTNLPSPLSPHG